MTAEESIRAGNLGEALASLQESVRANPADAELSELLELPDNDLWDIVSGRSDRYDVRFEAIVARLRAS